ncbi:DUF2341 domain-containing protein, partial [bacterium]|nr:DUF2341 domain-containing protein [bacterium]
ESLVQNIPWWKKFFAGVVNFWNRITQPVVHFFVPENNSNQKLNQKVDEKNNQEKNKEKIWSAEIVSKSQDLILRPNQTANLSVRIKNTGNQVWLPKNQISINVYNNFSKSIYHPSWRTRLRPAISSRKVEPNKTIDLSFQIKAPNKTGIYQPTFQFVYFENSKFKWLKSNFVSWKIEVKDIEVKNIENNENSSANSEENLNNQLDNQENESNDNNQEDNSGNSEDNGSENNSNNSNNSENNGPSWGSGGSNNPTDTIPPETKIDNLSDLPSLSNSSKITFQFSANEESNFQCKLDENEFEKCFSPKTYNNLSEGSHNFQVRAIDLFGNVDQTPSSFSWTIDFTSPEIKITSQPENPTNNNQAKFEFSSSENVVFECSLDDSQFEECSSPKIYSDLEDGYHLFSLQAKDEAGNYSQVIDITWLIDTTPPEIEITKKPDSLTNQTEAEFEFVSNENSTFYCKIDNNDFQKCFSPKKYQNLSEGKHNFYLKAKDNLGNESEIKTYSWTIDLTGPISSIDSLFTDSHFNYSSWPNKIYGNASDPDNNLKEVEIQVQKGLGTKYLAYSSSTLVWQDNPNWLKTNLNYSTSTNLTIWQFDLPNSILDDQNYIVRTRAIDSLGNIQNTSSTAKFIFDSNPPDKPKNLNILRNKNSLEMNLSWDKANDNLSGINYYEIIWQEGNQSYTSSTKLNSFKLKGKDKKEYNFKIEAVDRAGNKSDSSEISHFVRLPSLVISEIQINGREFVELFNSTDKDINLSNYYLAYYSQNRDWNNPRLNKKFPDNAQIKKNNYYLIDVYNPKLIFPPADWTLKNENGEPYRAPQLSNKNGSVVIYPFNPEDKSIDELKNKYVDLVAWGDPKYVKEGEAMLAADSNQSLERKPDENYVFQDTDNNKKDFFIQENPNPKNSLGINNFWLENWGQRKVLVIDNLKNDNDLTDYQIKVNVNYEPYSMNFDFSDIRFTDSDGKTSLNYYRESFIPSNSSIFWVKIPFIPRRSEKIIYLYYDNPSATYIEKPEEVFDWYDDFSTERGSEYNFDGNLTWDTQNSKLIFYSAGHLYPKNLSLKNFVFDLNIDSIASGQNIEAIYRYQNENNYWYFGGGGFERDGYQWWGLIENGQKTNIMDYRERNHGSKPKEIKVKVYETKQEIEYIDNHSFKYTYLRYDSRLNQFSGLGLKSTAAQWNMPVYVEKIVIRKYTIPEPTIFEANENYLIKTNSDPYLEFPGWDKRIKIKIKNQTNEDLNDYQVKIEIPYKKGMQLDFGDLRFTEIDGQEIPFYRQSYQENQSAIFWLKLSNLLSNSEKEIYLYYDNPSATYIGKGEDVFDWYDDFSSIKKSQYSFLVGEPQDRQWQTSESRFWVGRDSVSEIFAYPRDLSIENFVSEIGLAEIDYGSSIEVIYHLQDKNNYWYFGGTGFWRDGYQWWGLIENDQKTDIMNYHERNHSSRPKKIKVKVYETKQEIEYTDEKNYLYNYSKDNLSLSQAGKVGFYAKARSGNIYIDYFFVRKYIQPEPIVTIEE